MSSDLLVELLVRVFATAGIVIGITLSVERLGPKIGGALAGLPIVIGPAFFFIVRDHSIEFSANAAAASLISLAATQAFLLAYIFVAARSRAAILAATLAWAVCAWGLSWVAPSPWTGLLIFLPAMIAVRILSRRFVRPFTPGRAKGTLTLLVIRGVAAGLLVAGVTAASWQLGPVWAGLLISYPVGLTVISMTIHHRSGADMVISTLRAVMLGVLSPVAFTFVLAVLLEPLGPVLAFALALIAGVLATSGLILVAPKKPDTARS
ncbi:hypothetical protein [Pseudorhodobacter aquimaris]|uniref:hypothetical protein n=1 Tax=Pseudorhodobacter aquimaris TaxID=687412 RepID=UPI00067BEB6A|nr:hypothetical protein [Pseudorhodobacter aquimaris]